MGSALKLRLGGFFVMEMDTLVVRQFLNFFQDFIHLCQKRNWPNNDTTPEEIRNAFLMAQHIEKCLDKFQKRLLIDEFLSLVNNKENTSSLFLKNCLSDPPKYILKKIINSSANISQVDVGFTIFLELYSEQKLEVCLSDLMLEAASKETLLKCLKTDVPKEFLLEFKTNFLLSEVKDKNKTTKVIEDMLNKCTKDNMELLVQCILCKDLKYDKAVDIITEAFVSYMDGKTVSRKTSWKLFFDTDEEKFLQLCLNHSDIFKVVATALVDVGECLRNEMSLEHFYIELTYSDLVKIVQMICKNDNLKLEFLDIVAEKNVDFEFWTGLMP